MTYQHRDVAGQDIALPVGKVVCIGQNYQDHIAEMNSKTAPDALFFIKPETALVPFAAEFAIPLQHGEVHNETELAVLLKAPLRAASPAQVLSAIWGVGLALDLTLRTVQAQQKQLGRPWEIAKGFDGACPMGPLVPLEAIDDVQALRFALDVNGQRRQTGDARLMIRGICQMNSEMSHWFTLKAGDLILTGTPAGVGPLHAGDMLTLSLDGFYTLTSTVSSTSSLTALRAE